MLFKTIATYTTRKQCMWSLSREALMTTLEQKVLSKLYTLFMLPPSHLVLFHQFTTPVYLYEVEEIIMNAFLQKALSNWLIAIHSLWKCDKIIAEVALYMLSRMFHTISTFHNRAALQHLQWNYSKRECCMTYTMWNSGMCFLFFSTYDRMH